MNKNTAKKSKAQRGATEVGLGVVGHDYASACGPSDFDRTWGPELNRSALQR